MTAPQDPFRAPDGQPGPYGPPPGQPGAQPGAGPGQPAFGDQAGGFGQPGSSQGGFGEGGGQGGYGQPAQGGYGSAPPVRRNGLGTAALVLGILALVLFWTVVGGVVLGIAAIVLGVLGRGRAKRGEADNGGMAVAGAVLGLLGLLASVALVVAGASFLTSETGQQLQQCLEEAQGDRTAEDACAEQFGERLTQ